MQVKIIIGTIAFMLTMIILGFVALGEPARLARFTGATDGRSIENGAEIYITNCSTCHGVNGMAQECFDPATGEQVGCAGLALNNPNLLCGSPPPRLEIQEWQGTLLDYVRSTVTSGRPWNGMPTWGQEFGGPLADHQVEDVAMFVVNWSGGACDEDAQPEAPDVEWPQHVSDLPEGDAARGEEIYNVPYGCAACHGNLAQEGTAAIGPWLGDIEETGDTRKDGYTAADYVYESILLPNAHIAPDCPNGPCTGPPSAMPDNFAERMQLNGTPLQDMADILAFLLGTSEFESSIEVPFPREE